MRLPVLGGAGPSEALEEGELAAAIEGAGHPPVPIATVCVLGATPTMSGVAQLARALATELGATGLRAGSLDDADLRLSLEELYAPLAAHEVVIARGPALLARAAPTLTVLITGGLLPPTWSREARAARGRVDVALADAREDFARALAAGWTRSTRR